MSADSQNPPQAEGENTGFTSTVGQQASTAVNMVVDNCEVTAETVYLTEENRAHAMQEIHYQQMASEPLPNKEIAVESSMMSEESSQPVGAVSSQLMEQNKQIETESTIVHLGLTDIVNAVQEVLAGDHRLQESGNGEQHGVVTVSDGGSTGESFTVIAQESIVALNQGLTDQNNGSIDLHSSLVVSQSGMEDASLLTSIANDGLSEQSTQYVDISTENPPRNMEISSDFGNVMVNTLNLLPSHRKDPKVYSCNYCVKTFSQPHQLIRHERMHTGEKPYVCDVCGKGCSQKGDLVRHKRKHTGERPYQCDICPKAYFKSADLKYHKRKHMGEKPYKCSECNKAFTGLTTLRYHSRTHTGEKPYECDVCKKRFTQSSSLKLHKATHLSEKPHECDQCDKKYASAPSLKCHKTTHTCDKAYKPVQCEICNKTLSHLSSLICHRRTHTGEKPFQCDQCPKAYSQSYDLKRHMDTHTGNKHYKCDICDKAFYWSVNLREHRKKHEEEKPFKCEFCPKAFAWSSALGHHKRQHHMGDQPHRCDTCGRTFAQIGYLNRHIKSKHSEPEGTENIDTEKPSKRTRTKKPAPKRKPAQPNDTTSATDMPGEGDAGNPTNTTDQSDSSKAINTMDESAKTTDTPEQNDSNKSTNTIELSDSNKSTDVPSEISSASNKEKSEKPSIE